MSEDVGMKSVKEAVEHLSTQFREPLETAGVGLASLLDEIEDAVEYARKYLRIELDGCQRIWYKLHIAPDAVRWQNILALSDLCFSLPFTTAQVERIFSMMKIIKTDRRTTLQTSTLSDLLEIQVEGPPIATFSPDRAVTLWWNDSTRRVNQVPRKEYKPRASSSRPTESVSSPSSSKPGPPSEAGGLSDPTCRSDTMTEEVISLEDWDNFLASDETNV